MNCDGCGSGINEGGERCDVENCKKWRCRGCLGTSRVYECDRHFARRQMVDEIIGLLRSARDHNSYSLNLAEITSIHNICKYRDCEMCTVCGIVKSGCESVMATKWPDSMCLVCKDCMEHCKVCDEDYHPNRASSHWPHTNHEESEDNSESDECEESENTETSNEESTEIEDEEE